MINKLLILTVGLAIVILTGCANGFAYGNATDTPVRNVTVSWENFRMYAPGGWGGGISGTHEPFPDKLTFSWEDSRTGEIKSVELEVPKQARGYPWGGLKMLIHSNGVIEVMHSRNGKKVGDHGYRRKITDQW